MARAKADSKQQERASTRTVLNARPYCNEVMKLEHRSDGTVLATIPMKKPKWLVPPLSWVLPYSSNRRVELDELGASVLEMCDGDRTVEGIIEKFAADHKLSFREGQLAVTQFLQELTKRGLIAIVGTEKDADNR